MTNKVNGKRYIGQTTRSVEWRWNQHVRHVDLIHFPIYRALRKYGVENFEVETLAQACSIDCLNYLESALIIAFNSLVPSGYNLDGGGKNKIVHPETRAKQSMAHKGKPKTAEHRAKIGAAHKGRQIPLEQRARLSGTKRGREITVEEYREIYRAKHSRKPKKSNCKEGHILPDEPNTFERGKRYRRCRACALEYQRNYDRTIRKRPHGRVAI